MKKKSRLGKLFSESINRVSSKTHHFYKKKNSIEDWQDTLMIGEVREDEPASLSPWRKIALSLGVIIFFSVLLARLFHLQVVEGSHNRELADSNRIQVKVIHAPRGVIYDRNGKILTQNEPGFRLIEEVQNKEGQTRTVRHLLRDQVLEMEVNGDPRLNNIEVDSNRTYPFSQKASHILGYVGEVTEDELKDPRFKNYNLGDKIGRTGIEEEYEKILRGIDGGEVVEVDASGKVIRTLRKREAIAGQNLYLTINADLQSVVYEKLEEAVRKTGSCCGSAIAQDPKTGEILALVSYPGYDPEKIGDAINGANSPLLNRAIGGVYPPGSTFKMVSSLAGLASGKITPSTTYEDTGVMSLGPYKFANWYFTQYGRTEGQVNLVKALQRSNDIYFYKVGEAVGENAIRDAAKISGFGEKLGIDLPGEETGIVPDNDWKVKNFNQVWYPGDTLHMAIGQGFMVSTPLQILNLTSYIASDGNLFPPHLALKITDTDGKEIKKFEYDPNVIKNFKQGDLNYIKKGMEEVPKNGGTAWPFFTFPVETAGKTGTAEFGDPKGVTHAWYTAYAPVHDPNIAMTVLIERGGEGSSVASPVVKEVFRSYFSQDKKNMLRDIVPVVATESARTLGE